MLTKGFATAVSLVVIVLVAMGWAASPALAETHPFLEPLGGSSSPDTFTNPNGIAVEESTGDVYVADIGTNKVYKFDASGNAVDFSALGTNALTGGATPAGSFSFPEATGTPAAIAVDNSSGPSDASAGDLYVMDAGHGVIDKFNAKGEYLGQIVSGELAGFGIEANGDVRVQPGAGEHGFAVSPAGDVYVLHECGCWEKNGQSLVGLQNLADLGRVDSGPGGVAAAVDPVSGHLYIDDQSSVAEWDTGGMNGPEKASSANPEIVGSATLVSSFGSLQLSSFVGQQGGIAVNGANGEIYVADPAEHKVYVFASTPPAVAAGAATNVSETGATLHGAVDPRGVPVTSCEFEYEKAREQTLLGQTELTLPVTVFAHKVACAQTPNQIGSGTSPVGVSVDVGGLEPLEPGVLYHFRVVAGNASGTSPSEGLFVTAGSGFAIKPKSFEVSFLNRDGTPDTQAGSHPYTMVTNFAFKTKVQRHDASTDSPYEIRPDGNVKDIIVVPPPGLVGDPSATEAKCTLKDLEGSSTGAYGNTICPPGSQVGTLEVEFAPNTVENNIKEPLYNMVAPHGVAAQFAGNFIVPKAFIDVGLQAGGQYPVQSESLDIPAIEPIIGTRVTLFGEAGQAGVIRAEEAVRQEKKCEEQGSENCAKGAAAELEEAIRKRKPFLTLPTGCTGPLRSSISADTYQQPGHYVSVGAITHNASGEPVPMTGCSLLTFPPAITVEPDVSDASSSSGLTVGVHVPQTAAFNPDGLAESALRDTTVTLPEGVALNPAGADGLEACSEGLAGFTGLTEFNPEFEAGVKTATFTQAPIESLQPGVSFCPDSSKIGTVKIKTPLLPNALEGAVYLAAQDANPFGSLIAMYMIVEDPVSGSTVKLAGEVLLCENAGQVLNGVSCQGPGQIVTTFKNTPDLPFEELELHFFGGERAPLRTPSRCGTYTTKASFTPWDGNAPVNTFSSFQITSGPNGSPCPSASLRFNPSLNAGTTSNQAGEFSPFTMTMSRKDGEQNLQGVSLHMPPGLSGLLTGLKLCGEAEGNAGTCGPESEIGETIVSVGVGGKPFSVKGGKVFLTGPYEGAPFGLSIVNPAKAGPYDLEKGTPCDCVVVRAKIEVDPVTSELTITTDNTGPYKIPTILDGIPLEIQHVNVTVNRPGFTFNPTNCNPFTITGDLSSTEGDSKALSVPFQATNCAVLGFKPQFKVATSAKTSRANGASLDVKLSYPKGPFGSQANIKSVKVDLPKQLPSRLTTLQKACPDATFNQNPAACPAGSRVGEGTATTPLIPVPLSGPAYFVSHGGAKFPELIIVLSGYGVTVQLHGETFINKAGITSSTFRQVPDLPVGTFELKLPERSNSALAANGNLCTTKLAMPTAFTAQNGTVVKQSTPVAVTGCKPAIHLVGRRVKRHTATLVVGVPSGGRLLATGAGLSGATGSTAAAGNVTISLTLTRSERLFLSRHPGRKLRLAVKLLFIPKHGAKLSKQVTVLLS